MFETVIVSTPAVVLLLDVHASLASSHCHVAWVLVSNGFRLLSTKHWLRRLSLSDISLVVFRPEFLLKPINHILEWIMILVVEEVTSWLNFDKFSDQLFLGNVAHNHVLWILL